MQKIKNAETVAGVHTHTHTGNSIKKEKIKSKTNGPIKI